VASIAKRSTSNHSASLELQLVYDTAPIGLAFLTPEKVSSGLCDCDEIQICVEDSGIGIDEENMPHLFEAFFTTKPNGMGMGLSICRSIIESHGGRLWAEPGRAYGAAFFIRLPTSGMGDLLQS
jgi:signal transduction histidine kinase